MDGLEATQHIKARANAPLVIILTFYDTPKYRQAAHQAGADGFVPKADFGEKLLPLILTLLPDLIEPDRPPVLPAARLHTRPIEAPPIQRPACTRSAWLSALPVRTVIMAGGDGTRLWVLSARRVKPAVPFEVKYRIIDFALSTCGYYGLFDVMVLTQYLRTPSTPISALAARGTWIEDLPAASGCCIPIETARTSIGNPARPTPCSRT
jgi:hypothetical protein